MPPPADRQLEGRELSGFERSLVIFADKLIYRLTYHWLFLFNFLLFLFLAFTFLAPLLFVWGYDRPASLIFRAYGLVCHQEKNRSFFILGEQVAVCQRDVGAYGGLVLGGLLYGLSARKLAVRRLRIYLLFVLPLAIDGLTQLVGLRESFWQLRLSTGLWFGIGTVLLVYPIINRGMEQTRREMDERFGPGLQRLRK